MTKSILFINPYGHHSYFTVKSLTSSLPTYYLCPALTLQLLFRQWSPLPTPPQINCALVIITYSTILLYILFKLSIVAEQRYLSLFSFAASLVSKYSKSRCIYCYQDYMLPLLKSLDKETTNSIVELIIDFPQESANVYTTIQALNIATAVVAPSRGIALRASSHNPSIQVAHFPYGGDKASYQVYDQNTRSRTASFPYTYPSELRIVARANTYRKGAQVFAESLHLLFDMLEIHAHPRLQLPISIFVAGHPESPEIASWLQHTSYKLPDNVTISCRQYSQLEYSDLLGNSHLFVMPSSLEGVSPAALEALWLGLPSVLTPECGVECFLPNHHGFLINHSSPDDLAQVLFDIVSQPDCLNVLHNNLVVDKSCFSWDSYLSGVGHYAEDFFVHN